MTNDPHGPLRPLLCAAAGLLVLLEAGCSTALTTAYLRDGLWEKAATDEAGDADDATVAQANDPSDSDAPQDTAADPAADRERREAALEEAMARLARLGQLAPGVESALVATLQRTQPEDWPVVVDEFAASLTAAGGTPISREIPGRAEPEDAPPSPPPSPPAPPAAPPVTASAPPPAALSADPAPAAAAVAPAATVSAATASPSPAEAADPPAAATPAALALHNACFASAVRAWGDVDRFPAERFRPGQELIVYVELENLTDRVSAAGHVTCIDADLRLVDDAGRTVHAWSVDPIAETCPARRRDYFARYVVRIPDSAAAGPCRVELAVTDTLAGATARATLPLDIAPE